MYEIRNENDLYRAIQLVDNDEWAADQTALFVGWPHLEITVIGRNFEGGVPTRIMPGVLELQRVVRRAYARSIYGYGKEQRMTYEDRNKTELIVHFLPGSTKYASELISALNWIIKASSDPKKLILGFGTAPIITGLNVWKTHINTAAEERDIEYRIRMSQEETERLRIVERLAENHAELATLYVEMNKAQSDVMKGLHSQDRLMVGDEEMADGETSKRIFRSVSPPRVEDRLDGNYLILSVESGEVRNGFRVRVRNIESGDEFKVSIPEDTLPQEQISHLQSGEWEKISLHMQINVVRAGNRILRATLLSAGLSRTE